MKKIILFMLLAMGVFADRTVETTNGEVFVLKNNGRWMTESEYNTLAELNSVFDINITNISGKRKENKSTKPNARRITFNITNKDIRDYSEVVVKITLYNEDQYVRDYVPVAYTTIRDLKKNQQQEVRTLVENLIGLEGRNFELEVVSAR